MIRLEMDSQRSYYQLHKYVDMGLSSLENVWGDGKEMTMVPENLRLNLKGMTTLFRQGKFEDQIEPLLMEIDIEYPWLGRQNLIIRGLEALTEIAMKTHLDNLKKDSPEFANAVKKMEEAAKKPPVQVDDDV